MQSKFLIAALIGTGVLATGNLGAASWNPADWFKEQRQEAAGERASGAAARPGAGAAPEDLVPAPSPNYRAIVERFGPAVVGITTEGPAAKLQAELPDELRNDPFHEFFRGIPGMKERMQPRGPARGQGSGFIITGDGIILTNAHVVRDAREVTVKISDRREYKAKVLGSDPATDVAVLKIDATGLPVVKLGDPDGLGVGDHVLAIGSPFGFEHSATSGIVSAKGRSLPGESFVPFIQTDVAVNPGNSGGPLFDAHGNVVGINSQIYSGTGGYQGISFAIPIDVALQVKDQIVKTGKVTHARLGVSVQEVSQALADSFQLRQPGGALVSSVAPGSAADKAGLKAGDVILKYDGAPIDRAGDLSARVGTARPGDKVQLDIWRAGGPQEITAVLAPLQDAPALAAADGEQGKGRLGLSVRPLEADERREGGAGGGLLVERSTGPAARAGVAPGDVIIAVNGKAIGSAEDLRKHLGSESRMVALLIQRGEEKIFVPVPLS